MKIDLSKINPRGKLKHLLAKDLFKDDAKQVFDAKSGKYLGLINPGQELPFAAPEEPEIQPQEDIKNPQQLNLF